MDDLRAEYKKLTDFYDQKRNLYDMSVLSYNQLLVEYKPIIKGCDRLLGRMSKMKFFDPACGSGNFLIITYKQLRLLEMDILRLRKKCIPEQMLDFIDGSCIRLDQFFGIELLDFPHEVAMLSLWLAEHQMNNKFHADFGVNVAALPLKNINQIKCGNACRLDWEEVCPHTKEEEVFVFGNPPYLGSRNQDAEQKADMHLVFGERGKSLDFAQFEPIFAQAHHDLKTGKRQLKRISKTDSLAEGRYYLVDGQMVLLQKILEKKKGKNGLPDGRTRCVYENGTESDIYLQTLRKYVVANGYAVTETQEEGDGRFFRSDDVKQEDQVTGYIYVLRSTSENPEVKNIKNLYKIGFSTNKVEERVANAEHEPTYLMAPVEIVSTYKIVNMHSQKFEDLVHQVLQEVNFRFKVADDKGEMHEATEWYQVPLEIIDSIIRKIMNGTIVYFSYNKNQQCLEQHIEKKQSRLNLSGMKALTLTVEKKCFEQIVSGEKTKEYRELKQVTLNKYTYIDESDGKRYLKRFDALRFCVGNRSARDCAVVQVLDTVYKDGVVTFYLGKVLDVGRG